MDYRYTVEAGDNSTDLDYTSTRALYWRILNHYSSYPQNIAKTGGTAANCLIPTPGMAGSLANQSDIRVDGIAPKVVSVSSPNANGTYGVGSGITVAVTFDDDVAVNSTGGVPLIVLNTTADGVTRSATYDADASTARTLAFKYTVRAGDDIGDLTYANATALSFNNGTIKDDAGNNASLALPVPDAARSLGSSKDIAFDTAASARPSAPCSPDPSDCIFRFTDTPVVERLEDWPAGGSRLIEFDPASDRLYVAYGSVVAVYDAGLPGYPLMFNATFPGSPGSAIRAMAANTKTGDLYVATATTSHTGATNLYAMNSSGSLSNVTLTTPYFHDGQNLNPLPSKLYVDSEQDMVYMSTILRGTSYVSTDTSADGILAINATDDPPAHIPFSRNGWRNTYHAWHVSSMAVNSTGQDTIVYAMNLYWEPSRTNWASALSTLRFSGGGGFDPDYVAIDRIIFRSALAGAADPAVNAHDMVLDDRNDKLFILLQNHTLVWYDLTGRASGSVGLPTFGGNLERTAGTSRDLVIDERRGLLYWFTSTSVGVYRTLDGERLAVVDRPGQDGYAAAIDAVPASAALPAGADAGDVDTGIVYALGQAGPQLTVIDPRPESLPERLAREAADGGTVAIPDGTYRDVYLSTDAGGPKKAMTIRSESGQPGGVVFTGASHIRVLNGDVAVQGIVFRDTTCHDKLEGADSPDGYLPEHVVNVDVNTTHAGNITISDNVFENTCYGGILSGGLDGAGSGNASDVLISNNTFRDIGYNARHYDGVPDSLRHAIETGAYPGAVQMRNAEIASNTFERIAGIAVDIRQARNLDVSGNAFADVPLSAVRLHGGSDGIAVRGNTITNASYSPNYDFLRGVDGSANLTQDAAILVIPDDGGLLGRTGGVNATGNTVSKSGGAFSVCGAVCEGNASAGYATTIGSDADSVLGPAGQDIRFNWNTIRMDNGDRLVENGVRGALDARYNYYPGYEPAAGLFRAGAQASGNLPAGTVLYEPLFTLAPDDPAAPSVMRVASANASDSYGAGDQIDIAVVLTKPVAITGTPVLTIDAGPVDRSLDMVRHDASVLSFSYAVADGDSSPALEYANRSSLAAGGGGGGIADLHTGAPANLTLPPMGSPESLSSQGLVIGTPDTAAPTVLNVTSGSADGTYGAGRLVEVHVVFSENVFVGTGGGTPFLLLDTGGAGSPAGYARGSGTETLVFEYRPAPGEASGDLDYAGTDSFQRSGGTIADRVRNAANLTLPEPGGRGSLAYSKDIAIDTEAPRVVSVSSPDASDTYGAGSTVNITVSFSEAVHVTGTPVLALSTEPARDAEYVEGTDDDADLAFRYEVRAGDAAARLDYAGSGALALGSGTIRDADGNNASLGLPPAGSSQLYASNITIGTGTPGTGTPGTGTPGTGTPGTGTPGTGTPGTGTPGTGTPGTGTPGTGTPGTGTPGTGTPGTGTPGTGGPGNQTRNATTVLIGPGGVQDGQGDLAGMGEDLRVTIDLSGLPGAGTAGGTVRFPQAGATVTTSFGSVSFPPRANATSVPADGLLVLHAVPADGLPSNSTVQSGLAYDGSGTVALQRVVEVGDENARIIFDMPVRISLEGQAGGRAFYIAGADGTITPIDAACGADDTDRVHLHLNGTGECRIESDGDMVVYTYHLTRFGTVRPESGAPPPVYYTCSVDLGMQNLAIDGARPGEYSAPAPQTILNTGSAMFANVGIEATRWTAGPDVVSAPDAGAPSLPPPAAGAGNGTASSAIVARVDTSLPAGLTEVSEAGAAAGYAAVGEGTAVAAGLGGGDVKNLWFKLNLTPYDAAQGGTITQSVTYSAQCTEP